MTPNDWLQFIGTGVAGIFGLFCLFDGTRRLAAHGRNASGRQMIGAGLAIVLMLAGYAYWKHRDRAEVARAYQPVETGGELPDNWRKKVSPATREASSLELARGLYVHSGVVREYFDINGKRVRFAPSQADVKQRELFLGKAARLEEESRASFLDFVLWLVWGAAALVFGPLFAREPVAAPADAEAEAGAEAERREPTLAAAPHAAAAPAQARSKVGEDTVPLAVPPAAKPAAQPKPPSPAKSSVGEDTVPLPKPPDPQKR